MGWGNRHVIRSVNDHGGPSALGIQRVGSARQRRDEACCMGRCDASRCDGHPRRHRSHKNSLDAWLRHDPPHSRCDRPVHCLSLLPSSPPPNLESHAEERGDLPGNRSSEVKHYRRIMPSAHAHCNSYPLLVYVFCSPGAPLSWFVVCVFAPL